MRADVEQSLVRIAALDIIREPVPLRFSIEGPFSSTGTLEMPAHKMSVAPTSGILLVQYSPLTIDSFAEAAVFDIQGMANGLRFRIYDQYADYWAHLSLHFTPQDLPNSFTLSAQEFHEFRLRAYDARDARKKQYWNTIDGLANRITEQKPDYGPM